MLDAAVKALSQMFSPPFRTVLLKSIGLALLLIVLIGFGLYRALIWAAALGETWAQTTFGVTSTAAHDRGLDHLGDRRRSASSSARSS